MEVIREVTDEDASSDVEYSDFRSAGITDSFQQLRQEVRAEVLARQFESETSASCCGSCSCSGCVKTLLLTTVIVLIWLALTIPTIFYTKAVVDMRNRGADLGIANKSNGSCMAEVYTATGSECDSQLSRLLECYQRNSSSEQTNNTIEVCRTSQNSVDGEEPLAKGKELAQSLQSGQHIIMISEDCKERLTPFACLYLFPLAVYGDDPGLGPTARSCETIRDDVCTKEWTTIEQFGKVVGFSLPNCEALGEDREDLLDQTCAAHPVESVDRQLNCSDGFKKLNSSCVPVCQQWSAYSPSAVQVSDIIHVAATSFALLTGVAVLVIACIRRKRIFTYPSIFVVYQTITPMLLGGFVLIGFVRRPLFCSSEDLISSIMQPTPFCIVTGIAFHYLVLQLMMWWLCHTTAVFQGTLFPFHTKRLRASKKLKYIHALMVVLALVLPGVLVAIIATAGSGFTLTRQPTILCSGYNKHYNFAFMVVPISVGIAIGSTMLVLILCTVIKRHIQAHRNRLRVNLNWTAEAKVLVVIMYYIILGVVVLTIFTVYTSDVEDFAEAALKYFNCERSGPGNATICQSELEHVQRFVDVIPTTIAFVLLGFYPIFNLVYTVNIKELRSELACMERKVQVAPPYSRPGSRENRVGGNIQSVTPYPTSYIWNGVPHRTSSFSYERPTTFSPHPPDT